MAFDCAGVPGQGQSVADGVEVELEAVGEGVQGGQVAGVGGGDPVVQEVAVAAGEDLGGRADGGLAGGGLGGGGLGGGEDGLA